MVGADGAAVVGGDGRGGLEAVELGRGVHLGGLVAGEGGGRSGVVVLVAGHGTAAAHRGALFFVQGEGVDVAPVRGGGGGAEVEYPDDLRGGMGG